MILDERTYCEALGYARGRWDAGDYRAEPFKFADAVNEAAARDANQKPIHALWHEFAVAGVIHGGWWSPSVPQVDDWPTILGGLCDARFIEIRGWRINVAPRLSGGTIVEVLRDGARYKQRFLRRPDIAVKLAHRWARLVAGEST